MASRTVLLVCFIALLLPLHATTVILNSLDYEDIIAANVFAKANSYSFVFSLTPNQGVFIVKYYTVYKAEPIIYMEGTRTVLPNMEALIRDSGAANVTVVRPASIPEWVADSFPKDEAIVVGLQYGQDAVSISPYAALTKKPIFFIGDKSSADEVAQAIRSRGYSSVLLYGPVAHQIPQAVLSTLPNKRVIDTGSRYSNNLQIVSDFLALKPSTQVMFASGRTFEKSMVDKNFPVVLMGRSDVSQDTGKFLSDNGITAGIVFAGDADIVDSVNKLRSTLPKFSLFVKFGEGYLGSAQPFPLTIIPLPSPRISLDVLNISYNVPSKLFELKVRNSGDFVSLSSGISVPGVGSGDSPLVYLDPGAETTIAIPLDAASAISGGIIPEATLTVRYGEDTKLLDNIDSINYRDIGISSYTDNSNVKITGFAYNPQTKSFDVSFDGTGFVDGTVRFSMNDVPVTIRVPTSPVSGPTTVSVKYLLSSDEESFINGLPADYSFRFGAAKGVLLREAKGTISTTLKPSGPAFNGLPEGGVGAQGGSNEGGLPWIAIIGGAVLLIVLAFVAMKMRGGGKEEF